MENKIQEEKKSIGWGIASLVTGIASLPAILMPYFGLPLAIFAIVANYKQKKIVPTGIGLSGMICGIIGVVINGITLLLLGLVFLVAYGSGTL